MGGNFNNPSVIAGQSGSAAGPGHLEDWFYWDASVFGGNFVFYTTGGGTLYPTTLRVYQLSAMPNNPVQMSDLTEVTYIHQVDFPGGYGYQEGAVAGFTIANSGLKFYIKVASRDGISTGALELNWKRYFAFSLGACGVCDPTETRLCKMGTLDAAVNTSSDGGRGNGGASFGNFPAGTYELNMCPWQGQFPPQPPGTAGAGFYYFLINGAFDHFIGWFYYDAASGMSNAPSAFTVGEVTGFEINESAPPGLTSQNTGLGTCINSINYGRPLVPSDFNDGNWAAGGGEAWRIANEFAKCYSRGFCHAGGSIGIIWSSQVPPVYVSPDFHQPFALFLFDPATQIMVTGMAGITNTGLVGGNLYSYSVTVNVQNVNLNYGSGQFTLTLNASAQIVNPSAGVVMNLAADGTGQATFTFQSTGQDILSGTFGFRDCAGNVSMGTQTVVLATALIRVSQQGGASCGSQALAPQQEGLGIINIGVIPISSLALVVTGLTPGGLVFSDPATPPSICCTGPFDNFDSWQIAGLAPGLAPAYPFHDAQGWNMTLFAVRRADGSQPKRQLATAVLSAGGVVFPALILRNLGIF